MAQSITLFYVALVFWAGLIAWSAVKGRWMPSIAFGLAMAAVLNSRYITHGMSGGVAYFVGIFDVPVHIGANNANVVTTCPGNLCTVSPGAYQTHSSWAVAFYDRFVGGPPSRVALLYGHIIFNTIALVMATFGVLYDGYRSRWHKVLGYVAIVSVSISLLCAGWLTSELGTVDAYARNWTMFGLYFLSLCVLAPVVMGIRAAARHDLVLHRIWMWRFVGALWGSYWIFRGEMLLVDLIVRDAPGMALAIPSWTAGAIGFVIGDLIRRRLDRRGIRSVWKSEPADENAPRVQI